MTATCQKCGKSWGGLRPEHCKSCCQTFSGTTAGDMHRTGRHAISEGPDRRRCLTPDEMVDAGLVLDGKGIWRLPGNHPRNRAENLPSAPSTTGHTDPDPPGRQILAAKALRGIPGEPEVRR